MTNYVGTKSVTVYNTVEEATAGLETKLEEIVNTQVIRTCTIIPIEANKYAAVLVHTDAVA